MKLSHAQEIQLAKRIEKGDRLARKTMIESNLGLVRAVGRTFHTSSLTFDDLVQEGSVGLIRAVERFDHRRDVRFSTYAAWWIRRAIMNAIDDSQVIRTPAKARRQLAAVRRTEAELTRKQASPTSDASISAHTGIATSTVRSLRAAARVTSSLDQPVGDDGVPLLECVSDPCAVDLSAHAIQHETRDEVNEMMRLLPERHREVVVRRFGLNGDNEQSHAEIGRLLGVGEERSRQLEREALRRLRSLAAGLDQAA